MPKRCRSDRRSKPSPEDLEPQANRHGVLPPGYAYGLRRVRCPASSDQPTDAAEPAQPLSPTEPPLDPALPLPPSPVNQAPVITAAEASGRIAALPEETGATPGTALSAMGRITFRDADLTDGHTVVVSPTAGAVLGRFTATLQSPASGGHDGEVVWSFELANGDLESLRGQPAVTQIYAVEIADGRGGSVRQEVVITLEGEPELPPAPPQVLQTLDFEGITGEAFAMIPQGYGGFQWQGSGNQSNPAPQVIQPELAAQAAFPSQLNPDWVASGYGAVRKPPQGYSAIFDREAVLSRTEDFDLISGSFSPAWNNGQTLEVEAWDDGQRVGRAVLKLDIQRNVIQFANTEKEGLQIAFEGRFTSIDALHFLSQEEGIWNQALVGFGTLLAIDDLVIELPTGV